MTDADYVMDFFEWVYANAYPSTGHFVTDAWLEYRYMLNIHSNECEDTINTYLREHAELYDLFRAINLKYTKRAKILTVQMRHSTAVRYIVLQILRQYMSLKTVLEKHREAILRILVNKVWVFQLFDVIISEVIEQKNRVDTDAFICRLTEGEEQGVRDEIGNRIRRYAIHLSCERDGHLADLLPRFAAETIVSALRCGVITPEDLAEHSARNELSFVF